jgi:hypothetical protein
VINSGEGVPVGRFVGEELCGGNGHKSVFFFFQVCLQTKVSHLQSTGLLLELNRTTLKHSVLSKFMCGLVVVPVVKLHDS